MIVFIIFDPTSFGQKSVGQMSWLKVNGTVCFQNANNCMNTNIYSHLETSGGQSSNPYLNVVHLLNTRAD